MKTVNEIIEMIESGVIKFDIDEFEPTDSQGYSMEGTVEYNGEHYITLAYMSEKSYIEQVAEQIVEDLSK